MNGLSYDWVKDISRIPRSDRGSRRRHHRLYQGHIPGAVGWNWTTQLCDTLVRDVIPKRSSRSCSATRH